MLLSLDTADFRRWLSSYGPTAEVGVPVSTDNCPLCRYLHETRGQTYRMHIGNAVEVDGDYCVTVAEYEVGLFWQRYQTDMIIATVADDDDPGSAIYARLAIRILDELEEKWWTEGGKYE